MWLICKLIYWLHYCKIQDTEESECFQIGIYKKTVKIKNSNNDGGIQTAYLNKCWNDHFHSLANNLKTVSIIQAHDIGSHECKNRHDIVKNFILK